jgi:hypothetical protein
MQEPNHKIKVEVISAKCAHREDKDDSEIYVVGILNQAFATMDDGTTFTGLGPLPEFYKTMKEVTYFFTDKSVKMTFYASSGDLTLQLSYNDAVNTDWIVKNNMIHLFSEPTDVTELRLKVVFESVRTQPAGDEFTLLSIWIDSMFM